MADVYADEPQRRLDYDEKGWAPESPDRHVPYAKGDRGPIETEPVYPPIMSTASTSWVLWAILGALAVITIMYFWWVFW